MIHNTFRNTCNNILEELCEKIDTTQAKVQSLTERLSTMDGQADGIPANPKQADFEHLHHWCNKLWLQWRSCAVPNNGPTPTLCAYMEDECGDPVLSEIRDEVLANARGFLADCLQKGRTAELLFSQGLGFEVGEEFHLTLKKKHPWLCLCAGCGKVYQVWTDHFRSWRKSNMPKEVIVISDSEDTIDSATTKDSKDATDPIDIDDHDDGVAATGMKCGNTDKEGAGASKCQGGPQQSPEVQLTLVWSLCWGATGGTRRSTQRREMRRVVRARGNKGKVGVTRDQCCVW